MGNGVTAYDATTYPRQKAWRLERELATERKFKDQLMRLLIVTLERQFAGTDVDPLDYLRALIEIDDMATSIGLDPIAYHRANT